MRKFLFLTTSVLTLFFFVATMNSCKKKEACDNVNCNNGGNCVDGTCQCDTLHEGTNCETEMRSRYFRSAVGNIVCDSSTRLDYVTITADSDSLNVLNFHNLLGEEQNVTGTFLADGTVNIPSQYSGSNIISGTASIINGKLVVNLTVMYAGTTQTCTWTESW